MAINFKEAYQLASRRGIIGADANHLCDADILTASALVSQHGAYGATLLRLRMEADMVGNLRRDEDIRRCMRTLPQGLKIARDIGKLIGVISNDMCAYALQLWIWPNCRECDGRGYKETQENNCQACGGSGRLAPDSGCSDKDAMIQTLISMFDEHIERFGVELIKKLE